MVWLGIILALTHITLVTKVCSSPETAPCRHPISSVKISETLHLDIFLPNSCWLQMSTKCQLLLFEELMMDWNIILTHSRIYYYDLTDVIFQVLVTKNQILIGSVFRIQIDQIWGNYCRRFFFQIRIKF